MNANTLLPTSPSTMGLLELLAPTTKIARAFLEGEALLPAAELRHPDHLREALDLELGDEGQSLEMVLDRMGAVLNATPSSSGWRFLNQLFGGRIPVATVAEMLTALPNVSMYTFKAAGAQVLVENEVLRRMAGKVGFNAGEGCFTPGGSMANLVAMLLARNEAVPGFRDNGTGQDRLVVYTSAEGHYSIPKAAGILGIGRANVRAIKTRSEGQMDVAALAEQICEDRAQGLRPLMVNATAGTTVRGAFDPIAEIAAITHEQGLWLHVDGALGGSMVMSETHRHLVEGAHLADSYAWNPHKMMGVPLQSSVLLVARKGALARSLDETADYLFQADVDEHNPGHRSIQCGRRNDAFKLWAAWLHLGDKGWNTRIDRQMALAQSAAKLIDADPALVLAEWPQSINICFEVKGKSSAEICDLLDQDGRLKIGHGNVHGKRAIRLVCVNPDMDDSALQAILAEIKDVGSPLPGLLEAAV